MSGKRLRAFSSESPTMLNHCRADRRLALLTPLQILAGVWLRGTDPRKFTEKEFIQQSLSLIDLTHESLMETAASVLVKMWKVQKVKERVPTANWKL